MMAGLSGGTTSAAGAIRAGRAFVEMTLHDNAVYRSLDKLRSRFTSLGAFFSKMGGAAAGAGAAILAPITAFLKGGLDRSAALDRLSQKLGVPVEKLNAFSYAAELTGHSLEDLTGDFENWAERVAQGAQGTGEALSAFQRLGLSAADLQLMDPVDQLIALSGAMQQVTNETERLGLLSKFGGDKFQWLNALLKQGPEGIRASMGNAPTFDKEAAANARALAQSWTEVKLAVQAALMPIVNFITPAIRNVAQFAKENANVVLSIAAMGVALVIGGTALVAFGAVLASTGVILGAVLAGVKLLAAGFMALLSPVGLAVAAVGALGYLWATQTESGQEMTESLKTGFQEAAETAKTAFAGIADAVRAGDIGLAFEIALTGLKLEWAKVVVFWTEKWNAFKGIFVDGWHAAVTGVALMLNNMAASVEKVFEVVSTAVGNAFRYIADIVLEQAERIAMALDSIDPTDSLKGAIQTIRDLRATVSPEVRQAVRDQSDAKLRQIAKERDAIEKELMQAHTREQQARNDARKADLDAAKADIARLEEELHRLRQRAADVVARPVPQPGGGGGGAIPKPQVIISSAQGAFAVPFGGQQFGVGSSTTKKMLTAAEKTAKATEATEKALLDIGKNLRWH